LGAKSHNSAGLSTALAVLENVVVDSLQPTTLPGVRLLASGPTPPNPGELLSLDRTARILEDLQKQADVVLVDSPPVLVAADSVILASQVDGVILVADIEKTRMDSLKVAVENLRKSDGFILGLVLNKLKPKRFSYYGNQYPYYYYYYSHYYKSDPDESELDGSPDSSNGLPQSFTSRLRNRISRIVGRSPA
jgi:capsular exopolysaccharide synthesis family protein